MISKYYPILTFLLLFTTGCSNNDNLITPKAVKGVIDLRNWNFEKDGSIFINGEWYFYYKIILKLNKMKLFKIDLI